MGAEVKELAQLGNTLGAVVLAAIGVETVTNGGDWKSALYGIVTAAVVGVIKALNPLDKDLGVHAKR